MTHNIPRARNSRRSTIALSVLIILLCLHAQAKRKDLVIMKNGDHLTGEVKKLEQGVLYVDLEYVSVWIGSRSSKSRARAGFRSYSRMASGCPAQSKR